MHILYGQSFPPGWIEKKKKKKCYKTQKIKKKKGSQTLSIKITFVHRVYDSQMYFQ
jgi:hypothetical protein